MGRDPRRGVELAAQYPHLGQLFSFIPTASSLSRKARSRAFSASSRADKSPPPPPGAEPPHPPNPQPEAGTGTGAGGGGAAFLAVSCESSEKAESLACSKGFLFELDSKGFALRSCCDGLSANGFDAGVRGLTLELG